MLLAATLFFSPHYAVTLDLLNDSVTTDKNGNAYIVSVSPGPGYFDPMPLNGGSTRGFLTKSVTSEVH